MRELNLLPEQQKRDLSFSIARHLVVFFSYWVVGAAIVFGVLLFPAYFFIAFQQKEIGYGETVEEGLQRAARVEDVEKQVRTINTRTHIVHEREAKKRDTAALIKGIFNYAPAGVSVSFLSYRAENNEARVAGNAASRSLLLQFIDALRGLPELQDLSSPVANLIKEEDIDFTLTLVFRP